MPTESRTYQAGFASRPVKYGGFVYVWIRVPVLNNIHGQTGVDGDWSRWQLCKLEPVAASEDPEEISEANLVAASDLVSLEVYADVLEADEPLRAQPLFSKDIDADNQDPHPNAFVQLSGKYLLFCPAPEAVLLCWDLETFEEAWRIDARRPESGTQQAFRILDVRDSGEFVVAFRERHFIQTDTSTVLWNEEWGEDTDGVFLASFTMDTSSSNVSPAGRLLLNPATGAENHRWEASEIEAELFHTVTEANNYYKYLTLVDDENWPVYENAEDDQAQFLNGQPFSLGFRPQPNAHQGTEFEIARVDPETGRSWSNMGAQINGTGLGYTAVSLLGNPTPDNAEPAYTFDSSRNEGSDDPADLPSSTYYVLEDPSPGLTGAFTRRIRTGWSNIEVGPVELDEGVEATFAGVVNALTGYSNLGGAVANYYIPSVVPATVYKNAAGSTAYSALEEAVISTDKWVDWLALDWQNDDLAFSEDSGDDICEGFVLPGAMVFSGANRVVNQVRDGDRYVVDLLPWTAGDWWANLVSSGTATMVGRFFFGSDQPEIPVPGTLPQHSLVRSCQTDLGTVYGPSVAAVRGNLPFVWRLVDWAGGITWTISIPTTKSRRQATVPICMGDTILTYIQEWDDEGPGPVRLVRIDLTTGLFTDTIVLPELHGGFSESYGPGVFLGHETVAVSRRLALRAGGHLVRS